MGVEKVVKLEDVEEFIPKKRGGWTKEEDAIILEHKGDCKLSQRNANQCKNRYRKLLEKEAPIKRGGWTKVEDEKILQHGKSVCDKDWSFLAEQFPDRNAKQCNNRFKKLSERCSSGAVTCKKIKEEEDGEDLSGL